MIKFDIFNNERTTQTDNEGEWREGRRTRENWKGSASLGKDMAPDPRK
jgi:hypothetical protein